ncbi:type VI secretion system contractile sheath large subunit [Anatilimnocola sp. NA78]|uniref:type VI secretion system contractile sheath domain-containing protein n=1 Tax=Anatilimnocola sp. NA78 TaxID=3415683 RepID=UPI003CE4F220
MSKSWQFGGVNIGMDAEPAEEARRDQPLKIVVLGDFSGRGSRRGVALRQVGAYRPMLIDRDNFEQVMQHLNVELDQVPLEPNGKLGLLAIGSLDDFHPDALLQRVNQFKSLRELRRQLANRDTFAAAKAEAAGRLQPPAEPVSQVAGAEPAPVTTPSATASGEDLLEQMLAATEQNAKSQPRRPTEVERYAQALMANYTVPADDPRQEPWVAAADQAIAFAVRQLLQDSAFKSLEARWRAVDWLTKRVESDVAVKIAVVDITPAELRADFAHDDLTEAALYELLVTRPKQRPGDTGWQVIVVDERLSASREDVELLGRLCQLAGDAGAKLLVGLTDAAVGCTATNEPFVPSNLQPTSTAWSALQQLPEAVRAAALWPGFLLRQPYGKKTSEVEAVELEELAGADPQQTLLWGNAAYLAADQLLRSTDGSREPSDVSGLPCVVLPDATGTKQMVPATGWWLRESSLDQLAQLNITAVYALPHAGAVRVFPLRNLLGQPLA